MAQELALFTSASTEPVSGSKLFTKGRTFVITKILYDDRMNMEQLIARCIDVGPQEGPFWRISVENLDLKRISEH
jgi:hypothetical protein